MLTDVRLAARALRASPGFTAVVLIVLTLGIGATTAIFSVVDAIVLRGLPFDRDDRLVAVEETNPTGKGLPGGYVAAPNFFDWRAQQKVFEEMAAYQFKGGFTMRESGEPVNLSAMEVSASLFPVLRVNPALGRAFGADAEAAGRDHVALISDGLWRRRFGADPHVVGRTLTVDAGEWEIVGVMPAGFAFPVGAPKPTDLWVPYVPTKDEYPRGDGSSRNYNAQVIARLEDGVTLGEAQANMEQITGALKAAYPKWFRDRWVGVTSLHDHIVGKARGWMLLLLGAVAFVLLIACVNVANLLLARATAKSRDLSVRAALGATRWQLARGLIAESLLLSFAGTALGVVAAIWGVQLLKASLPPTLPRLADVAINLRVLVSAAGAAIVTGLAFGALPAWQFSRPNLASSLREGGRSGAAGTARARARTVLLVAEVALAVVLVVGAGLFLSSFVRLMRVDIGMPTDHVLTIGVYPRIDFNGPADRRDADMAWAAAILTQVLDRVRAVPGVDAVAVTGNLPLRDGWSRTSLTVAGHGQDDADFGGGPDIQTISPDYFRVTRIPLVSGRPFTEADSDPNAPPVIMLNDVAVQHYFDGRDPIGQFVECNGKRTVVGVVRAVRLGGPEAAMRPEVYTPYSRTRTFGASLMLRTSHDPALVVPDLRNAIRAVMPDYVIPDAQTLDGMYDKLIVQRQFNMIVLVLFGALAIVIAAVGIYGVMAYIVEQRTQEIGVRMALGAAPGQVLRMVLGRAGVLMAAGLAIGLAAGWMLGRFVNAFLFHVEAHDPVVYLAGSAVLVAAGLLAAFVPARRAAGVDPITVLR